MKQQNIKNLITNQRGQGVVEYVLILVVTVAIILGGVLQLNRAFATWANNYFGEYLSCLLETGELPSLGDPNGVSSSVCEQSFEPFSLASGRQPIVAPGGGSSRNPSNARSREAPPPPVSSKAPEGGNSNRMAVKSSGGGSGSSGDDGAGARAGVKAKPSYTGSSEVSSVAGLRSSSSSTGSEGQLIRYSSRGGYRPAVGEEEDLIPAAKSSQLSSNEQKRNERILINRKIANQEVKDPDVGLGVGDFLRIILIVGIIIAIFVFFAGQAVQINKSM